MFLTDTALTHSITHTQCVRQEEEEEAVRVGLLVVRPPRCIPCAMDFIRFVLNFIIVSTWWQHTEDASVSSTIFLRPVCPSLSLCTCHTCVLSRYCAGFHHPVISGQCGANTKDWSSASVRPLIPKSTSFERLLGCVASRVLWGRQHRLRRVTYTTSEELFIRFACPLIQFRVIIPFIHNQSPSGALP